MGGFHSKSLSQKWEEVGRWADQERPWSDFQVEYVKLVHNSKKPHLRPSSKATNEHAVVRSRVDKERLYKRLHAEIARRSPGPVKGAGTRRPPPPPPRKGAGPRPRGGSLRGQ